MRAASRLYNVPIQTLHRAGVTAPATQAMDGPKFTVLGLQQTFQVRLLLSLFGQWDSYQLGHHEVQTLSLYPLRMPECFCWWS